MAQSEQNITINLELRLNDALAFLIKAALGGGVLAFGQ
jgi:hypothetical protein